MEIKFIAWDNFETLGTLCYIFLATHSSERTGKGNPLIVSRLGRDAFEITDSSIKVTIPYNWKHKFEEVVDNQVDKLVDILSKTESAIFETIKKNPKLSQPEIAKKVGVGKTTVQSTIAKLKKLGFIVRHDSNKTGYWEIKENSHKIFFHTYIFCKNLQKK